MVFTPTERDRILGYLGYPVTQSNVQRVLDACNKLTQLSPDAETRIKSYLDALTTLESQIATERIVLGGAYTQLKTEARVFVGRISTAVGIEANENVF